MKSVSEIKKEAAGYRKVTPRKDLGLWEVQTHRPI